MCETTIRERPILFSGPMVRSILDGRKTQTRRVLRPQPALETRTGRESMCWRPPHAKLSGRPNVDQACGPTPCCSWNPEVMETGAAGITAFCPHGQPGDRIWVRETWLPRAEGTQAIYRADYSDVEAAGLAGMYSDRGWRPSIFMPRWASRITLELTDVRVERLQQITEADAIAEGAPCIDNPDHDPGDPMDDPPQTHLAGFIDLWQKLNGPRGFGWDVNPWVWVISFRRITDA